MTNIRLIQQRYHHESRLWCVPRHTRREMLGHHHTGCEMFEVRRSGLSCKSALEHLALRQSTQRPSLGLE
ncbi:hypothetical protein KGM_209919A, partial [Danaus plexippus plexippus]